VNDADAPADPVWAGVCAGRVGFIVTLRRYRELCYAMTQPASLNDHVLHDISRAGDIAHARPTLPAPMIGTSGSRYT
jgi:hypothetical protein